MARYSQWRAFVTQVAVLLLVAQSAFGVMACPNRFAFAANGLDAFLQDGAICSHAPSTDKSAPVKETHTNCPMCLGFVCHTSAILSTVLIIPAPDAGAAFASETISLASGLDLPVLHNRGPPLSFPA